MDEMKVKALHANVWNYGKWKHPSVTPSTSYHLCFMWGKSQVQNSAHILT